MGIVHMYIDLYVQWFQVCWCLANSGLASIFPECLLLPLPAVRPWLWKVWSARVRCWIFEDHSRIRLNTHGSNFSRLALQLPDTLPYNTLLAYPCYLLSENPSGTFLNIEWKKLSAINTVTLVETLQDPIQMFLRFIRYIKSCNGGVI